MSDLMRDIRYGLRALWKHPGFTAVAVLTLALGIGANTAMFSAVNAVLIRPLAYPNADQIVVLEGVNSRMGITDSNMSIPDFADWKAQNHVFDQLAGFVSGGLLLTSGDETERVRATSVTTDFFPLFQTAPIMGRTFTGDDAQPKSERVVVMSFGLWQRKFGGRQDIIGQQLTLGGKPTPVVGIMPKGFDYPDQSELWVTYPYDASAERRDNRFLNVVARLRPNVTVTQAKAELDTINSRLAQTYVETNADWTARVTQMQDRMVGSLRKPLLVLLGAVAFVLLIACANVANLFLAKATGRQREIAVRTALGASRWRVIRQLLTESLLLSSIGGVLGLMLGIWLVKLLVAISPANTPRFDEISPDLRVLLFALALTVLTGVVFGLAPALHAADTDLNSSLKDAGRSGSSGVQSKRLRSLLMVTEIAFSFILLVGAGLLMKSFLRLRDVTPGFAADNVLTMRISLLSSKYSAGEPRTQLLNQVLNRLKSIPNVEATGAILSLPMRGDNFNLGRSYIREGRPATPAESGNATYLVATPSYFQTLKIPLIAGRTFSDQDSQKSTEVVIVNQTLARKLWPGESPIGRRITIWRDEKFPREIVGVVGDTKATLEDGADPQMYVPFPQDSDWGSMSLVVRTTGDPTKVIAGVRAEIHSQDKGIPIYNLKTMDDLLAASLAQRRMSMLLLSSFAGIALVLAMIGIYGVTAYYVTQRTQEIGIRIALGARVADVMKLVLRRGMLLALAGVGIGLAGAFALTRLLASLLFGVKPTDLFTFAIVALSLLAAAFVACYLPARRASKIDALVALHYE